MIFNILFGILLFLFIYETYSKNKTCKEYLVAERNPWPKGCSKSQNNIATNQAHKIDNLESRILTYVNDIKQFDINIKNEQKINKKIKNELKGAIKKTEKDAKNAEKKLNRVKFKDPNKSKKSK